MRKGLTALLALILCACGGADAGDPAETSDDDLVAMGVTAVEVKVSVHPDDIALAEDALGLDEDGRVEGDVWFFDDASLSLYARGVVVRARHREGDADDATIKLRPVRPTAIPASYKARDGFKCEGDRAGGKTVVSCSLARDASAHEIDDVGDGDRDVEKLFDDEQETLPAAGGKGAVDFDSLRPLGPIASVAWKREQQGFELAAERWTLPSGERSLELSTRCAPREAAATEAKLQAIVKAVGARLSTAQETKTKRALSYFAGR